MTTYDDNLLAARFAALAPNPLLGDWGDVLGRVDAARGRRRLTARMRLTGPRMAGRRRLLVVFAVVALVAVVTASALAVRAFIVDKGFIGLPPVGATPSAPESGELVVRWEGTTAPISPQQDGIDIVSTWVYADGRIIWKHRAWHGNGATPIPEAANEFDSGYLEQRLAPEGVELVQAAVAELFDQSRALVEEIPAEEGARFPSHESRVALFVPNDYSAYSARMAAPKGDRLALLWAAEIGVNDALDLKGTLATPDQLSALQRVNALLADPASALPSSAWSVQKVRAYVPSHYAVCIDTSPPPAPPSSAWFVQRMLSMLPARAADLLRDKSRTRSEHDLFGGIDQDQENGHVYLLGRAVTYCFKVETEQAREVAEALSRLEREPQWDSYVLAYRVADGINGLAPTLLWFEPYFPDGRIPFSWPAG